jgi:hypothetical protein
MKWKRGIGKWRQKERKMDEEIEKDGRKRKEDG